MFSLLDVFIIVCISQGLFLILALQFIQQKNKEANNILSYLILIASVMLLGRISSIKTSVDWFWRVAFFVDVTIFLFGPLFYAYVRTLSSKEKQPYRLKWFEFIPAILHFFFFLSTFLFSKEELSQGYWGINIGFLFLLVESVGLLSFLFYWFKSLQLTLKLKNEQENQLSFEPVFFKYLYFFLTIILIGIILWGISFTNSYLLQQYNPFFTYDTAWITISALSFMIGFFSFSQPQLFRIKLNTEKEKKQIVKNRMTEAEIEKAKDTLEEAMQKEKVFTDPNLSLPSLAKQLQISSNDLSWLLNVVYKKSFYSFVNQYRVEEFVFKLKQGEHQKHTLLSLAFDVGFNSKSTFNKFFKASTNQTPREYLSNIKVNK